MIEAVTQPQKAAPKRCRYTCHQCGKQRTQKADEIIEQAMTGRRFCSNKCWSAHSASKGF